MVAPSPHTHILVQQLSVGGRWRLTPRKQTSQALDLTAWVEGWRGRVGWGGTGGSGCAGVMYRFFRLLFWLICVLLLLSQSNLIDTPVRWSGPPAPRWEDRPLMPKKRRGGYSA